MVTEVSETDMQNRNMIDLLTMNASTLRSELLTRLLDPRIDLDKECGYPIRVSKEDMALMYERVGIASRVVNCFPEESWKQDPMIYETEDEDQTTFEIAFTELTEQWNLFAFLQMADVLSGIGHFGVILLGVDDGKSLETPLFTETTFATTQRKHKLLYLRAFQEKFVELSSFVTDVHSARYGLPEYYTINFYDENTATGFSQKIHWSRIVHLADNRGESLIYGTPRMRPVYNNLMDVRKILGGSGEMFWKGGFPGYSFEVNPDIKDATIDATSMRNEFQRYANGLQRYLALTGVTAKSLAPQVADPKGHLDANMDQIAITMRIPKRVLFGSEQAQLASTQDAKRWNERLASRQDKYLSPCVIRPFISRLVQLGVLPNTMETLQDGSPSIYITWPDLNTTTNQEKADVADKTVTALAKYIAAGMETLIPRKEFFVSILGLSPELADAIIQAADEEIKAVEVDDTTDDDDAAAPKTTDDIPDENPDQMTDDDSTDEDTPTDDSTS